MAYSFTAGGTSDAPNSGTGDNGETWDPHGGPNGQGAWVKKGPAAPAAPPPTGPGGFSNADTDPGSGMVRTNGTWGSEGATLGKVRPMGGAGAYGGYSGTMVSDGKGGAVFDPTKSGRAEAVDRARGLGAAAANRQAYQINYGKADGYAGFGQDDRQYQVDAMNLTRDTANGNNLQSMALGQNMLRQGVQAQQAGAASARGGALAQAAAMRQQAAGQGAFMQAGNNQLAAQRAAEMAQGREMYMNQATGLRASDAQGQQLNQGQSINQMNTELDQRDLNQQGLLGYESMGQRINNSASDAALKTSEINAGIDAAAGLRASRQADRDVQAGGAVASTAGTLFASGANAFNQPTRTGPTPGTPGGDSGEARPLDPYSTQVSNSDVRGKTRVTSLATAAMMRRGR